MFRTGQLVPNEKIKMMEDTEAHVSEDQQVQMENYSSAMRLAVYAIELARYTRITESKLFKTRGLI